MEIMVPVNTFPTNFHLRQRSISMAWCSKWSSKGLCEHFSKFQRTTSSFVVFFQEMIYKMVSYGHMASTRFMPGWWFETCFFSPYIGNNNLIPPTDFNVFQRGSNHQPDVI